MRVLFCGNDVSDKNEAFLISMCVNFYNRGRVPLSNICATITDLLLAGV